MHTYYACSTAGCEMAVQEGEKPLFLLQEEMVYVEEGEKGVYT